jgi:hypothetical protein
LGSFQFFSKLCGDIRKSRCITGVNDTCGKFAASVIDTGGNLSPMSSLPPVLLVLLTLGQIATGVNNASVK